MRMMKRTRLAASMFGCALVSACASGGVYEDATVSAPSLPQIGWLHGNCLALSAPDVRTGADVAVVAFRDGQHVISAHVSGRVGDADECFPLLGDRRMVNLQNGLTFYRVDAERPIELGIGVLQRVGGPALPAEELLDTNGDGRRDVFSHCTTSEGVRFSVWEGEAYRGEPLWSGYYYLGYDTESDCPSSR